MNLSDVVNTDISVPISLFQDFQVSSGLDCLERLVSEMTYCVLRGTLNLLTESLFEDGDLIIL